MSSSSLDLTASFGELPYPPSDLWILCLLEIPLKIGSGFFLPLIYPSYRHFNKVTSNCIWSPPYASIHLEKGALPIRTGAKVVELFTSYININQARIDSAIVDALYHCGISECQHARRRVFYEFKESPRHPGSYKAYAILSYTVSALDDQALVNLVDPEGLRGVYLLPITGTRDVEVEDRMGVLYFRGKMLSSNLARIYTDGSLRELHAAATLVPEEITRIDSVGGLFAFDTCAFGHLAKDVYTSFQTLELSGAQLFDTFLAELQGFFVDTLHAYGFFNYRLEGDGFVAAIPYGSKNSAPLSTEDRTDFVLRCEKVLIDIQNFFHLKRLPITFVARQRASILFGKFCTGKIASRSISGPQLFGSSLIKLTRIRDHRAHQEQPGIYLSCELDDTEILKAALSLQWSPESFDITVKESYTTVTQFHLNLL